MGSLLSRTMEIQIFNYLQNVILRMMRSLVSRSVEVEISNNTQNITLKNPRIYLECGHCSRFPPPELHPGSTDKCHFPGSSPLWGVAGILVYEAESFTVAIHFSNPIDYNKFPIQLGLELSPGKDHLDRLEDTYDRMANGIYSSSCLDIKFNRVVVGKRHRPVQVSDGPVKVTATMTSAISSFLKVVLEEQEGSGEEAGTDNPCRRRHMLEK
ncbi:hypothetical protein HGM15179_021354 [Zosterops borbonicus]|uniref:Uncharacterized protein n=1 Tax=Zosterops borbonicus TaxID=364589 RepID=A0A8K1FTB1_9PASS|nr:hypothetical protein HGM15179_021354 [Zosterops borbonicus]